MMVQHAELLQLVMFCIGDPLVGSIAKQLLADKKAHDQAAADWTKRFAQG